MRVRFHNHGNFWLDGGAMFGSVPKPLWEKVCVPDPLNRIAMATRSLVLEREGRTLMVDGGNGDKWTEKQRAIFGFGDEPYRPVPNVTDLVFTHLHFDHCGGVSRREEDGSLALNYPQARHHVLRANLDNARAPNLRERASYLPENVEPLRESDLVLHEDGDEIWPGVTIFRADGHTTGLGWLLVELDGGRTLAYPSDLIPTSHHLPIPYVMGYDIWAERAMEEKAKFLARAEAEQWIVVFEHDATVAMGQIQQDSRGKPVLVPLDRGEFE